MRDWNECGLLDAGNTWPSGELPMVFFTWPGRDIYALPGRRTGHLFPECLPLRAAMEHWPNVLWIVERWLCGNCRRRLLRRPHDAPDSAMMKAARSEQPNGGAAIATDLLGGQSP